MLLCGGWSIGHILLYLVKYKVHSHLWCQIVNQVSLWITTRSCQCSHCPSEIISFEMNISNSTHPYKQLPWGPFEMNISNSTHPYKQLTWQQPCFNIYRLAKKKKSTACKKLFTCQLYRNQNSILCYPGLEFVHFWINYRCYMHDYQDRPPKKTIIMCCSLCDFDRHNG